MLKAPNLFSVLLEAVLGVMPTPQWVHRFVIKHARVRSVMLRPYAHRPKDIAPEMIANLLHGFGAKANHAILREARHYDYEIAARGVTCPIFVVHGNKDLLVPPADVERLATMAPVKKVVVLRETGHNPEIERPNTLNKVLVGLLAAEQPLAARVSMSVPTGIPMIQNVVRAVTKRSRRDRRRIAAFTSIRRGR